MSDKDKKDKTLSDSVSSSDSDIFSLSEESFFSNLSDIEELRNFIPQQEDKTKKNLQEILAVTESLLTTYDEQEVFELIISKAIELTSAERGYLILVKDQKRRILEVAHVQNMDVENKDDALEQVSSTIINRVIDEKKVQIVKNALKDEKYEVQMSIVNLQLRSIMCAPMIKKGEVVGIIYVENRSIPGIFDDDSGELLTFFGNQCAVAIENLRLIEENKKYATELEKKVEERTAELRYEKEYSEKIIENIGEILVAVDLSGKIIGINKAIKSILGLEGEEFINKPIEDLYELDRSDDILEATKKGCNIYNVKCFMKNVKEEVISFSATVSPIIDRDKVIGSIIINTDMTELEKYEKEKLEKNELASITKAAVTANDQINTPLGVIIGRAAIISSLLPENEKVLKNISVIKEQSYRIKSTLDEMKKLTSVDVKDYKLDGVEMLNLKSSKKGK